MLKYYLLLTSLIVTHARCVEAQTEGFKALVAPIIAKAKDLAHKHASNKETPKPIIAIAGCSAVGKSFFTRQIAKLLNQENIKVAIFQQDDFNQPTPVENTKMHPYFDYRRLHTVLQQIVMGHEHVKKPIWDKTGPKSVKEEVVACFHDIDLLLFEGTYTLCGSNTYDFLKYSNYKVFIDAPQDTIVSWNYEREVPKGKKARTKEKFDSDIAWDMEDYRNVILPTKQVADFIIEKDSNHNYLLPQ